MARERRGQRRAEEQVDGVLDPTLQATLAEPETYQGDGEEVARLRAALEAAEAEALRLTESWEELEAIASAASACSRGRRAS